MTAGGGRESQVKVLIMKCVVACDALSGLFRYRIESMIFRQRRITSLNFGVAAAQSRSRGERGSREHSGQSCPEQRGDVAYSALFSSPAEPSRRTKGAFTLSQDSRLHSLHSIYSDRRITVKLLEHWP